MSDTLDSKGQPIRKSTSGELLMQFIKEAVRTKGTFQDSKVPQHGPRQPAQAGETYDHAIDRMSSGINFPRMHVAESVINRILNAHDDIEASTAASAAPVASPPSVVDPSVEGAQIDARLAQSPMPVSPMPEQLGGNGPEENVFEATVSGGTPLQGLLDGISVG